MSLHMLFFEAAKPVDLEEATSCARLAVLLTKPSLADSVSYKFSQLSAYSMSEACVCSSGFVDVETPTLFKRTPGVRIPLVTRLVSRDCTGSLWLNYCHLPLCLHCCSLTKLQLLCKFLLKVEGVKGERWHLVSR